MQYLKKLFGLALVAGSMILNIEYLSAKQAQEAPIFLKLEDGNFAMNVSGGLNQNQSLSFAQLNAMITQSGKPHLEINMASSPDLKYTLKFITSDDTVSFNSETISEQLIGMIYNQDTLYIKLKGFQNTSVTYNEDYLADHKGKVTIDNPEFYELVNVLMFLSDFGTNEQMPFRETSYMERVEQHFALFREHKGVQNFNEVFSSVSDFDQKIQLYYQFRTDALSYSIDENGKITEGPVYKNLGGKFSLKNWLKDIESFYSETSFGEFFNENESFYQKAIENSFEYAEPYKIWSWLEERSEIEIHSYKIIITHLTNGIHSTKSYGDDSFSELIIFVSAPEPVENDLSKAKFARSVFTEIDHTYVNPYGIKNKAQIENVMGSASNWYDDTKTRIYNSNLQVFLEYMTWGVFTLYANDTYPLSLSDEVNKSVVSFMEDQRGFKHFETFNQALQNLYSKSNQNANIEALTEKITVWMSDLDTSDN